MVVHRAKAERSRGEESSRGGKGACRSGVTSMMMLTPWMLSSNRLLLALAVRDSTTPSNFSNSDDEVAIWIGSCADLLTGSTTSESFNAGSIWKK